MARRAPPTDASQAPAAGKAAGIPTPSLPGGASGIIEGAATKIHFPGVPTSFVAAAPEPTGEIVTASRYEVYDCPKPPLGTHGYRVLQNGVIAFLTDGKVLDTNNYDIEALRKQGVKMKALE